MSAGPAPSKAALLARSGALLVVRGDTADPELFLALTDDGGVIAFNGHVDLGTGIRTALAQIVAEELDVPVASVAMVLGHSRETPNQGATIASETIQVAAVPLRSAAATARRHLLARAAERLGAAPDELEVEDGIVRRPGGNVGVAYADLVAGAALRLSLDDAAPVKPVEAYRIVGRPVMRVDIPAKAAGTFVYVHDVRVPGMLHGRVVRPPYAGLDAGEFVGASLIAVDEAPLAGLPGIVGVVVIGDFVGVVAEREEVAIEAAGRLGVTWRRPPDLPDLSAPEAALRALPGESRRLLERGDVEAGRRAATTPLDRTYVWPYQMHASIGPSCAVADYREDGEAPALTVWSGTQNPVWMRADLARLLELPDRAIAVVRHEAAGCYGRNCADDVTADAALLSRAVGRPVRVQLSREQEHAWEPKGAAQVIDVAGGLDEAGGVAAYDFATRYPSNGAPTLALLLTGIVPAVPGVLTMGDRTAVPPYAYPNARVTVDDVPPIVRASWLRGVSALPNSFAHESWIDECASEAGIDPIAYRLRYLTDARAAELSREVAARAGWRARTAPGTEGDEPGTEGRVARGRGFAQALYVHGTFPGVPAAWSAWVADVSVDRRTGEVAVTRVVVGQDAGLMINPAGIRHQIHGNVVQATSRALVEEVAFEGPAVASREWGAYPILNFAQVPAIDVVTMDRPNEPPLGAGESASVPSAAAIANAIHDATGVRMRELPFTPERVRAALEAAGRAMPAAPPAPVPPRRRPRWTPRPRGVLGAAAAAMAGALAAAAALLPRPALAPIPRPDPAAYGTATIERGRLAAALGGCVACHSGPDGELAGGHALDTPFGRVWSTNITPDPEHGIGAWSYPAFARAMRDGVSRDGHHLYPAHPYASFARAGEVDLQALYAWLMTRPAIPATPPRTALRFPFDQRPLLAFWNALFLRPELPVPMPAGLAGEAAATWARGAELVEGLGHCGACHTPRNPLGAERGGAAHLAGAMIQGWEAPALTALSRAPIPWDEGAFYDYLRTGHSRHHGVAAGPMAEVVANLAALPDADLRAMAGYLASLQEAPLPDADARAAALEADARARAGTGPGARLYEGACAACHEAGGPVLFGVKPSLALNTGLHAERPDNLLRVVLDGIVHPARPELGAMPGFRGALSDRQVADLAAYLRGRFAPSEPAWADLEARVAALRAEPRP